MKLLLEDVAKIKEKRFAKREEEGGMGLIFAM